jgi:transcriptional regulator with XRE-family HTH domain
MSVKKLLDAVFAQTKARSHAQLARKLDIDAGSLSKVASGEYQVSASLILKVYDATNLTIEEIRELLN